MTIFIFLGKVLHMPGVKQAVDIRIQTFGYQTDINRQGVGGKVRILRLFIFSYCFLCTGNSNETAETE